MAGLGRGLGALLSASNRNKAKLSADNASYGIVARSLGEAEPPAEAPSQSQAGREIHVSGQTSALNNLLSSKLPEPKSLKSRQFHSSRATLATESASAASASTSVSTNTGVNTGASTSATLTANPAHTALATSVSSGATTPHGVHASLAQPSLVQANTAEASSATNPSTETNASRKARVDSVTPEAYAVSANAANTANEVNTANSAQDEWDSAVRAVVVESGQVMQPIKIAETNVVHNILLTKLKASVYQPRTDFSSESLQELAASIKEHGLLEPLLVTRANDDPKSYEIICGERRYRAAQLAGLRAVPCLIRELSDEKAYAIALIENIQREDLSPLEIAKAYEQMMHQCKYTQESLAKSLGKSRSTVANTLRLLKLEPVVQKFLRLGDIDVGHAKILLALTGEHQIQAASTVVEQHLSVAATDVMVKELLSKLKAENESATKATTKSKALPRFNNYEKYLNKSLKGVKAKFVVKNENQGKLTLSYTSVSELEYLLKVLGIPGSTASASNSQAQAPSVPVAPAQAGKDQGKGKVKGKKVGQKSTPSATAPASESAPEPAPETTLESAPSIVASGLEVAAESTNPAIPVTQTEPSQTATDAVSEVVHEPEVAEAVDQPPFTSDEGALAEDTLADGSLAEDTPV